MASYTVTSPDGQHSYTVEAPENASDDDVLMHVQQQHRQAAPPPEEPSQLGTGAAGLVQGGLLGPAEGIGQLL